MPGSDKESLLLSIREKIKQKSKHKYSSKTDETESSIAIAFFTQSYEGAQSELKMISDYIENSSSSRISSTHEQIFQWYEGKFIATKHSRTTGNLTSLKLYPDFTRLKTVVYEQDDSEQPKNTSIFSRRSLRIPTRK